MAESITFEDILDALRECPQPTSGGFAVTGCFSSTDLAEAMGCSRSSANHVIARAIHDGKIEFAGRERRHRIDGMATKVPVYRVVKPKDEPQPSARKRRS